VLEIGERSKVEIYSVRVSKKPLGRLHSPIKRGVWWAVKHLLADALPYLETYLRTLIVSYTVVQRDGTCRLTRRNDTTDEIDRIALDELEGLQRLIPKVKAALG
jgi:hypothetical protein